MADFFAKFDAAHKAFEENTLSTCDEKTLQEHLLALSIESVPNTTIQHRNIIRGITINHVLLQRHIDSLNKQNSKTQFLVIALTVMAVLTGIPQLWFAYKADKRAETEQNPKPVQQASPALQLPIPTPAKPPSSHPATVKQH